MIVKTFTKQSISWMTVMLLLMLAVPLYAQVYTHRLTIPNETINQYGAFGSDVTVPKSILQGVDTAPLLAEDLQRDKLGFPARLGVDVLAGVDLTQLSVKATKNEYQVSSYQFDIPDALGVSVVFDNLQLAEGTRLYIYNADRTILIGPVTARQNGTNFWSDLIEGSSAIVEVQEPSQVAGQSKVHVSKLVQYYRFAPKFGFGTSGACELNTVCYPEYQNEADGVAMLLTSYNGGTYACTGSIINSSQQDFRSYLLTAFHCYDFVGDGVHSPAEEATAATTQVRFHWESPTCATAADNVYLTLTGANFKAAYAASDVSLLELTQQVPPAENTTYLGWSRSTGVASSHFGIHHPAADIKKISFGTGATQITGYGTTGTTHHTSFWTSTGGVTEGGSSGSPLFDQDRRIIGQLHGGPSFCGATGTSLQDYYGRFAVSWVGGGTAATRLSDWLDPTGTATTTTNSAKATIAGPATLATSGSFSLNSGNTAVTSWTVTGGAGIVSTTVGTGNVANLTALTNGNNLTITFGISAGQSYPIRFAKTFNVTVPANTAPTVANSIPPQSATVAQPFTYLIPANTFTDAETPGSLVYTASGLPSGLVFTASSRIISGTPSTTVGSPFSVTVTATDPGSLRVSTTFALTVQPASVPVVVTALTLVASASPTTILTTGTTTLSATVTGGTTPYSYTFSGPGTITPSGNTASVSGLMPGVQTFTIVAKDATSPTSQSISTTVSVTVNAVNLAPIATANVNQTATVGTAFSYTVNAFTDETPNSLVYTASISPANGLVFDPTTRVITGTPSVSGVSSVIVTATDPGSLSANTTFTITVSASATQPTGPATLTVTSFTCLSTNGALSSVNFVVGYSNGSFTPAVSNLFINGVTITGQLGQTYTFPFDGNQSLLPIADNATRSVYFTWNFRDACTGPVTPPTPTAPVAPTLPNQVATQGTPFSYGVPAFTGTAPISYSATGLPAGLSFDANSRTISGTPSLTGVSTVMISASNAVGQSSGQFTITVSASATQPTGPATLTITSFTCLSTNGALSSVNFVVGYSNGSFTPAVPNLFINGVTITGQLGQTYTFPFDGNQSLLPIADNATRSVYFTWNFRDACTGPVTPPTPTAPVAPALPNQVATQGTPFSYGVPAFTGTAPISYSATGLPAGLSFDANSRTISGTPSLTGVSTVMISASNAVGQSSGQFTITVSASATQPTGPATLTITSFTCLSTNGALSSVNFVVGYSNGSFTPAVPNLFINGVTITGQLGQSYTFGFDGNQSILPIQDQATRSTYFVWNFRQACTQPVPTRMAAESAASLQINVLGNPVSDLIDIEVSGAEGEPLTLLLTDILGRSVGQQRIEQAGTSERIRFMVAQQPVGSLLLRVDTPTQSKSVRLLKAN